MAGQARLEALSQTEVVAVEDEEAAFEMRVGKVRTMVLDEDFEMRTPVVKIKGIVRGALFDTQVVLDATTTVDVIRGTVKCIHYCAMVSAGSSARACGDILIPLATAGWKKL